MQRRRSPWPFSAHPGRLLVIARRNLLAHKLRSALSILGVVFGVAAVVSMSSVGEGARREALREVAGLGIDTVTMREAPRVPLDGAANASSGSDSASGEGLSADDAQAIRHVIPDVVAAAPIAEAASLLSSARRRMEATTLGTSPEYARIMDLRIASGRFLATLDVTESKRVVVLGATLARALFPLGDALGGLVRVDDDWYRVVGVLTDRDAPRGRAGPIHARDMNRTLFVPWTTLARKSDDADDIDEIVLRARSHDVVVGVARAAERLVRRLHPYAEVAVVVPQEILRQRERTQSIFDLVTGTIAAVSLLVGGIGIMNIMLATVAERTEEIGVRRAVGATQADVAAQFVIEGTLLTLSGGALGTALGIAGSWSITLWAGWPTALSFSMLLAALAMAAIVGVGFSLYPAWHASRLAPMQALRSE
jgi:putative ABC transport system permease protein